MKKILVFEDDQDMGTIVEMALAGKYIVNVHHNTLHLSDVLLNFIPDLILIDNYIGQKQASEIIDEIRRGGIFTHVPFILFSGHHDIKRVAEEIRADGFLAKPFTLSALYSTIAEAIAKSESPGDRKAEHFSDFLSPGFSD